MLKRELRCMSDASFLKGEDMNKKEIYFLTALCMLISLIYSGCGSIAKTGNESTVLSLEDFHIEEDKFQYKNIPFGSSSEEATRKIKKEFKKLEAENSVSVSYYTKESSDFYGCDATLFLDFNKNKMCGAKIQFKLKEGEEQFQEILAEMTELYGEPEVNGGEGEYFTSEIYSWKKGVTYLQAILIKTEVETSAVVGVFKMD